jgi:hypothetical protein
MKLAVLCNKSRLIELSRLRNLLDILYVEYKTWIAGPGDLDSGWRHYALGYQRGGTNRPCFLLSATAGNNPPSPS